MKLISNLRYNGAMDTKWVKVTARNIKPGDVVIRNVEPGFEWVPGPYGAFVVREVKAAGDEFRFIAREAWGSTKDEKFSYDGDEEVLVKVKVQ